MTKNKKYCCITLDLESDHGGYVSESYEGWQDTKINQFLKFLDQRDVSLTSFVVGNTLEKNKEMIKLFESYNSEFHLHSFTHNVSKADSLSEIRKGRTAFEKHFGYSPKGYRAPVGRITKEGLKRLSTENFVFDASLFPSFWPSLSNFRKPQSIHKPISSKLLEVPFTVVSPLHIPLSLSWIKLVGWKVFEKQLEKSELGDFVVFGCHLHDFWRLEAFNSLPVPWKLVYSRNQENSFDIFEKFIKLFV